MAYIVCEDLTLGYDGRKVAEGLNFQVSEGDYLCIVGENGAGKSTLMKTLLHLIAPISGRFVYGDGLKPYEIGYLPQQTQVQRDFPASVWEIVLSGNLSKCKGRFFYGKKEKEEARKNMERMAVWDLRRKCYRNLSGGQQQRVLLARAMCATTKLLILDEPVSGLDPKVTEDFYRLLQELNQNGLTIIMVSHDMQATLNYASHIVQVGKEGCFYGTKEAYCESHHYAEMMREVHYAGNDQ